MRIGRAAIAELFISLLLLAALFYFADMGKIAEVVKGLDLRWFVAALALYFAINVCMAVRIWVLLGDMASRLPYIKVLMAHFSGMIASDFTPARSGYFTTAFVLSRNNSLPLEKTMVSIVGPQIFDFLLKATAGAIAFWYLLTYALGDSTEQSVLYAVIFGIFAIASMILVMLLSLFSPRFLRLMGFVKRIPFGEKLHTLVENIQKNSDSIKRHIGLIAGLLLITWFLKATEWYALAQAVGISPDVPFHALIFFAFLQPLVTILQFAPLPTFAGAGFSEAASVFVLVQFGVGVEAALVFSLLTRGVMILVDSLGVKEAVGMLKLGGK